MRRGVLTISVDVEAAWGRCDRRLTPRDLAGLRQERDIIRRLLALFAAYRIRATWAVVGHLALKECAWDDGRVHPEIARPVRRDGGPDWFAQHPPAGATGDPLWYGRDLLEAIRRASPPQELGSHSFCHLPYDPGRTLAAAVQSDLLAARRAHETLGLAFDSFVFPGNAVGFTGLLRAAGVRCYRGRTRRWYDAVPGRPIRRLLHLLSYLVPLPPPTVVPSVDGEGLVNIPDSMLLMGRRGPRCLIASRSLLRKGLAGLDRAVRRGEVFHLWFHPENFADRTEAQFAVLEALLRRADALRAQGRLEVLTMGDHVERAAPASGSGGGAEAARARAVAAHDEAAQEFARLYDGGRRDRFVSAFAYGRSQVEGCLREALRVLPPGSRILDAGCGTGDQFPLYRALGLDPTGLEPAPRMRALAQARHPGVPIVDGVVGSLPFPDGRFDAVVALEVLRYLRAEDIRRAYREFLRVLRPGGLMCFTMVNRFALDGFYLYDRLHTALARVRGGPAGVHCEFITPRAVARDLRRLGVEDVAFHGRLILPVRVVYKLHPAAGALAARALEPWDLALGRQAWTRGLAGHLLVAARRPALTHDDAEPHGAGESLRPGDRRAQHAGR